MSDQYLGEIRMFAGNYPPQGWAFCDGQTLSIIQNQALFSLLGTTYGGDGATTFKLPDLRGRVAMHQGPNYPMAQMGGAEQITLTAAQMPNHTHAALARSEGSTDSSPKNNFWANAGAMAYATGATQPMDSRLIGGAGGGQPHPNMMPFLTVSFIIALEGEYPVRP